LPEERRKRPLIVPIFIPYHGCPHRCIYCQQEKITHQTALPLELSSIKETLDKALQSPKFQWSRDPEVAFYGGTFTSLPKDRIVQLLGVVRPYIKEGLFKSIRISTRPDALDTTKLELLREFHVNTVELGTQSMDDHVLDLTRRGHKAVDTAQSVYLLKENGFKVGIQLMPGLPGDTEKRFMRTVDAVISLSPDMVRIYPTVVIKGTELADWYRNKRYRPLPLNEAIRWCKESCIQLEEHGIPVIRMGLMSSPSLLEEGQIIAGPWHRSLGFLVRSEIHQEKIGPYLPQWGETKEIKLRVPRREIPLVTGYKNRGLSSIEDKTGAKVMGVTPDDSVHKGQIRVESV
jgi:histone acetyltransferase (RNA polymerase elongator complex component)